MLRSVPADQKDAKALIGDKSIAEGLLFLTRKHTLKSCLISWQLLAIGAVSDEAGGDWSHSFLLVDSVFLFQQGRNLSYFLLSFLQLLLLLLMFLLLLLFFFVFFLLWLLLLWLLLLWLLFFILFVRHSRWAGN